MTNLLRYIIYIISLLTIFSISLICEFFILSLYENPLYEESIGVYQSIIIHSFYIFLIIAFINSSSFFLQSSKDEAFTPQ